MQPRDARHTWSRRITALLAALSLLTLPVELALPDVHDSDAAVLADATSASLHTSAPSDVPPPDAPARGHAVHVDHCAHGHLLPAVENGVDKSDVRMCGQPVAIIDDAHPTAIAPPLSRPPIA